MRVIALLAALSIAAASPAFAAKRDEGTAPAAGWSATTPAPADEYFGRMKMSVLGIHNELARLTDEVQRDPNHPERVSNLATLVEGSIHDWERHYPHDPWLARHIYGLGQMYAQMRTREGHVCALRVLKWVITKYRSTHYAAYAASEMSRISHFKLAANRSNTP